MTKICFMPTYFLYLLIGKLFQIVNTWALFKFNYF